MKSIIGIKLEDITSNKIGFSHLAELSNKTKDCNLDTIEVDFSGVKRFDSNMSSPLGVVLTSITDRLNHIKIVGLMSDVEEVLSKNHFLVGYGYPEQTDTHSSTIPYRRFKQEDDRYFVTYLNKHLEGKEIPRMSVGLGRRFKDSILEIFVNSAMHSKSPLGIFASGQFFSKSHMMHFCVADAGMGFRRNIYKALRLKLNSDSAILWAIKDGNTTKQGDIPGGLGLKLLLEFVALNGGRVQIVSDRGYWEWHNGKESASRFDNAFSFPGTAVNIEINTDDTKSYCLSSEQSTSNLP